MARDDGTDGEMPDEWNEGMYYLWKKNFERAVNGKKGQKQLRELRTAMELLPEKKLIEGALCTINRDEDDKHVAEEKGEGVCAVGAWIWWQNIKQGMSPGEAFAAINTVSDEDGDINETASEAKAYGMTFVMAWELAERNDHTYGHLAPEERYVKFMEWLNKRIKGTAPREEALTPA